MNHINWVQQEPDYQTEYHVLKWRSSHFHEPAALRAANSAMSRTAAAGAAPAGSFQTEALGIGLGLADAVKSGGFGIGHGQENLYGTEAPAAEQGQDAVSISSLGAGQQGLVSGQTVTAGNMESAAAPAPETCEVMGSALQSAGTDRTPSEEGKEKAILAAGISGSGQGSIRNRLKESAAGLAKMYRKQKEKLAGMPFLQAKEKAPEDKARRDAGTADRESVLAMQAQNHYLLDSYDRSGKYSMLGK